MYTIIVSLNEFQYLLNAKNINKIKYIYNINTICNIVFKGKYKLKS